MFYCTIQFIFFFRKSMNSNVTQLCLAKGNFRLNNINDIYILTYYNKQMLFPAFSKLNRNRTFSDFLGIHSLLHWKCSDTLWNFILNCTHRLYRSDSTQIGQFILFVNIVSLQLCEKFGFWILWTKRVKIRTNSKFQLPLFVMNVMHIMNAKLSLWVIHDNRLHSIRHKI